MNKTLQGVHQALEAVSELRQLMADMQAQQAQLQQQQQQVLAALLGQTTGSSRMAASLAGAVTSTPAGSLRDREPSHRRGDSPSGTEGEEGGVGWPLRRGRAKAQSLARWGTGGRHHGEVGAAIGSVGRMANTMPRESGGGRGRRSSTDGRVESRGAAGAELSGGEGGRKTLRRKSSKKSKRRSESGLPGGAATGSEVEEEGAAVSEGGDVKGDERGGGDEEDGDAR